MRRRGLPLGHELRGSLPVISPHAEKSLAASGSGLHAPGFQVARNHAPDRGETLHLHRQFHHASAAPGNHPYLKEPSTPLTALLSPASCYLAAYLPLCLLLLSFSHFFTFLCVPHPTSSPRWVRCLLVETSPSWADTRSLLWEAALSPPGCRESSLCLKCSLPVELPC